MNTRLSYLKKGAQTQEVTQIVDKFTSLLNMYNKLLKLRMSIKKELKALVIFSLAIIVIASFMLILKGVPLKEYLVICTAMELILIVVGLYLYGWFIWKCFIASDMGEVYDEIQP